MPPKNIPQTSSFRIDDNRSSQQHFKPWHGSGPHSELRGPRKCRFVTEPNTKSQSQSDTIGHASPVIIPTFAKEFSFTDNKTTVDFNPSGRRSGSRPPKKRQKTAVYTNTGTDVVLTARRPVKTYVPLDAWAIIFSRSHPKFLLKARLVCRDFNEILQGQTIWRKAREHTFDTINYPCLPAGLTEFQFCNLIAGRGCQIKPCHKRDTRRCFWPFMLRMCDECFDKSTQILPERLSSEQEAYEEYFFNLDFDVRQKLPRRLGDLLPAGECWSGRWAGARKMDRECSKWLWEGQEYFVIAKDYKALREEFNEKVMKEPSNFFPWIQSKWSEVRRRMKDAKIHNQHDMDAADKRLDLRREKEAFFKQKARELDPPMTGAVLHRMAAYHIIVDNANQPSLRSWELLKARIDIPELRRQAEQLLAWEAETKDRWLGPWDREENERDLRWERLKEHRSLDVKRKPRTQDSPEQRKVLEIAENVLDRLLNFVHNEDVLLMFLDEIRKDYEAVEEKPEGLNADGTMGEYRLLLDDARMVINDVLFPRIRDKPTTERKQILASLRCMGCTRSDSVKLYNFEQLIAHIRGTHANKVGIDMHFYRLATPAHSLFPDECRDNVAWYFIPWPKSMPALPCHQKASPALIWNPDEEQPYTPHISESHGLFHNMHVVGPPTQLRSDSESAFLHAIQELAPTRLDSLFLIRLALDYMSGCCGRDEEIESLERGRLLSINLLTSLETKTQAIDQRIEFRFKCGLCQTDPQWGPRMRETPHPQLLSTLKLHWTTQHNLSPDRLVADLVVLPTDLEVQRAMNEVDSKLEGQQKRARVRINRNSPSATANTESAAQEKARIDPRSVALLNVPKCSDRFARLFAKDVEEVDSTDITDVVHDL